MACTWASKVNGILTVVAVGVAVLIDLWDILDYKKGHSMVIRFDIVMLQCLANACFGIAILLEAFHRQSSWTDCAASCHLLICLLGSSRDTLEHRSW